MSHEWSDCHVADLSRQVVAHCVIKVALSCASWMSEFCLLCPRDCGVCVSLRCSFLFSVAVEWKLHPEQAVSEICRSRLQLFSLAGGASRADLRGSVRCPYAAKYLLHGAENDILTFKHYSVTLLKGGLLCFFCSLPFSCACKRSWKLKRPCQQKLVSPTENTAPETPRQQSNLQFRDFVTSCYVPMSHICIIYS